MSDTATSSRSSKESADVHCCSTRGRHTAATCGSVPDVRVVDPVAPVLVTGGGGYVASWIVRYLLENGYSVRATVRDPAKPTGLEHLHQLSTAHPGRLTLFPA